MRHKFLILIALLMAASVSLAYAQDSMLVNEVTFGGYTFYLPADVARNLNIIQVAGEPADSPMANASNIQFSLYNTAPAPESAYDGVGSIRIYGMDELALYEGLQAEVDALQTLLADRPDLETFENQSADEPGSALPVVPPLMHGQSLRARAEYVETDTLRGISYITISPSLAAVEPLMNNSFAYNFQGISTDGQRYVSVFFWLDTPLFPSELPADYNMETFSAGWDQYLADSATTLDDAAPGDFTPSLDLLNGVVESIAFG